MNDFALGHGFGPLGIWVLIIVLLLWAVNQFKRPADSVNNLPLEILKRRYARGEINQDEYQRKRQDLEE